jgi:hypothetical protein
VKTEAANRFIPLDSRGQIDGALNRAWKHSKFHQPDDLVFCTRDGKPLERRNLLRNVKKAARDLGLPKTLDFRSFRADALQPDEAEGVFEQHVEKLRRLRKQKQSTRKQGTTERDAASQEIEARELQAIAAYRDR